MLKRAIVILLAAILTFSLASCGQSVAPTHAEEAVPIPTEEPAPIPTEEVPVETEDPVLYEERDTRRPDEQLLAAVAEGETPAIALSDILDRATTRHKEQFETERDFSELLQYLVNDPALNNLITTQEAHQLLASGEVDVKNIPHSNVLEPEDVVADLDLLMRAFRSSFGEYFYYGPEKFDAAEQEILDWLDGQETVSYSDLQKTMGNAFSFLMDAHSYVGSKPYEKAIRYEYFYCLGQDYNQDDQGFYKTVEGEKWYFDSFEDDRVRMELRLTSAGEIVYSPLLFCPEPEKMESLVYLKNADGVSKCQTLSWTSSRQYSPEFRCASNEQDGILYVELHSFMFNGNEESIFAATAAKARNAKAVIMDIRSHDGGPDMCIFDWVRNFSGTTPTIPGLEAVRNSVFYKALPIGKSSASVGEFKYKISTAEQIPNDIPIFVLVDDGVLSSGESALICLSNMANVVVIGSNTAGYQISGNAPDLLLPKTKIPAKMGTGLWFRFGTENIDYKGYEPDVWVDPCRALDAVLNMILRYGLTDEENWSILKEELHS